MKLPWFALGLFWAGNLLASETSVHIADAAQKIERDEKIASSVTAIKLDAMRGEHELFQIVVHSGENGVKQAALSVGDLTDGKGNRIEGANVKLRYAHYLHCTKYIPKPQWIPDALLPCKGAIPIEKNRNQAFYGDIAVPSSIPPGIYEGVTEVRADALVKRIPIQLRVRPMILGKTPSSKSAFAIWRGRRYASQLTAPYPGMQEGSPEAQRLYERIYEFFVERRLMPTELPYRPDTPEAERYLNDPRIVSFSVPYDPAKPEESRKICDSLRKKGMMEKTFVYTIDEPGEDRAAECRAYYDKLHAAVKDARFLLTTNRKIAPLLGDKVDIWCPILRDYDRAFYEKKAAEGKEVWWYTCIWPKQPFPTYQLDDYGISPRILCWLEAKYQIRGKLYWCVNIWRQHNNNPNAVWFTNKVRDIWNNPAAFPNTNGDGYLVYPAANPEEEPIPSLRLEMIAQGNEEIDMMHQLKQAIAGAARSLNVKYSPEKRIYEAVNRIASGMTEFTKNPADLQALRSDLLDEYEALERGPVALLDSSMPEGNLPKGAELTFRLSTAPENKIAVHPAAKLRRSGKTAEFSFSPAAGPFTLRVTVTSPEGKSCTLKRVYHISSRENRTYELFQWGDPVLERRMRLRKVKLFPIPGSPAKGFSYDPNTDFPSVLFRTADDLAPYRWVKVQLLNPDEKNCSMTLKFHAPDGKARDGQAILLTPGERKTVIFPFNIPGKSRNEAFQSLEFWMWKKAGERRVVIESITLHSDNPESEASPW